jgi:hypothetical protein
VLAGSGPSSIVSQTSLRLVANAVRAGPNACCEGRMNWRTNQGSGAKNTTSAATGWCARASATALALNETRTAAQGLTPAGAPPGRRG